MNYYLFFLVCLLCCLVSSSTAVYLIDANGWDWRCFHVQIFFNYFENDVARQPARCEQIIFFFLLLLLVRHVQRSVLIKANNFRWWIIFFLAIGLLIAHFAGAITSRALNWSQQESIKHDGVDSTPKRIGMPLFFKFDIRKQVMLWKLEFNFEIFVCIEYEWPLFNCVSRLIGSEIYMSAD